MRSIENTFNSDIALEDRVINLLILNVPLLKEYGLFRGQIGISIALFEYGKLMSNSIYLDIADKIIENYLSKISNSIDVTFSSGISGIGWGVEYLIQKKHVECMSDAVCKQIDKIVMSTDILQIKDFSLDIGVEGILHYVLARIKGNYEQNSGTPFGKQYLFDLNSQVDLMYSSLQLSLETKCLMQKYKNFINDINIEYEIKIPFPIKMKYLDCQYLHNTELGLSNGLSGYILNKTFR